MIEKHLPDIVLTDIVMPGLNGLELIAEISRKYSFIRFIVLSSHSDYTYVREAMKLGAEDYILKASVKPEEMIRLMQATTDRLKLRPALQEAISSASHRDNMKRTMLRLLCDEAVDTSELAAWFSKHDEAQHGEGIVMVIKVHRFEESATTEMESALIQLVETYCPGRCRYLAAYKSNEFVALIPLSSADDTEAAQAMFGSLLQAIRRFLNVEASIGLSTRFATASKFKLAFLQAKEALQYAFYGGLGNVYRYDPQFFAQAGEPLFCKADEEAMERLAVTGDLGGLEQLVNDIFARVGTSRCYKNQDIGIFLEIVHAVKRIAASHGANWERVMPSSNPIHMELLQRETLSDMHSWFTSLLLSFADELTKAGRDKYREEVRRLIVHMKMNYADNLSLNDAAGIINMSPSYLSSLFKRETGKSFIEYLTEIRLEKAAELLSKTDLPSYLIAEKVGYENINYFGRAFKKEKGVSPSQYRSSRPE